MTHLPTLESLALLPEWGSLLFDHLSDHRLLGQCSRHLRWWKLSRSPAAYLIGTIERPGPAAGRKAEEELKALGCAVTELVPGRVFFRALGLPELVRGSRSVELVGVVVLRHCDDPIGTFLSFPGASTESCVKRLLEVVSKANWNLPLRLWSALTGQQQPRTFRVRAKRATKQGKNLLSSDLIAEEVAGVVIEHFGWDVDLTAPDIEVRVQLNSEELLVSLTALVQPLGGRGSYLVHTGLHPAVSWVLARSLDIQDGDVVIDPMCGKGVLLCEAAMNWPQGGPYMGFDTSLDQLTMASENLARARLGARAEILYADASLAGGIPLADGCVHKLLSDLPFGKQFGSIEGNEVLYPAALAEMARVLKPGGKAALLTSKDNHLAMRAALGKPLNEGHTLPLLPKRLLSSAWVVEHRRNFRLFCKLDACIYLLRRTSAPAPTPSEAVAATTATLAALRRRTASRSVQSTPTCQKLSGDTGALPWEDGSTWHEQWARERPALIPFCEKSRG
eukprot:TRINITY_DN16227_c0_g1_i1.p1 TRINITY_DN16227_c0_g1~~TRINITY_DN16227_c0_g1_i1.p1  ORF type:complete len:506 (+),score=86.03 TRINITY_DN16227_c0_g1_i1:78-1595(+)